MKIIPFAKNLALPISAITQKFAFLGQSGSGKTYAAARLAESMLDVGAQVIVLDPVGPWWSLRSSPTGKRGGFPISIFGGEHQDVPLTPESGALVAALLVEKRISAVVDLSGFIDSETKRFVRDFAESFFQQKKKHKSPVHIFWEEAQTFVPQVPERDENIMLNRVERLLKLGRNYGVGWSLITQQPQAVHKRCLNQAGTIVALRTIGSHEKKAIVNWVTDKVTREEDLNLLDTLPGLDTGVAHIWSPSFLKVSQTSKILQRVTFDASATPEFGDEEQAPRKLAPVDIDNLKKAMSTVIEAAKADNPETLRSELKAALADGASARKQLQSIFDIAKKHGWKDGAPMSLFWSWLDHHLSKESSVPEAFPRDAQLQRHSAPAPVPVPPEAAPSALTTYALQLLKTISDRLPMKVTRSQLAILAGRSPHSSAFSLSVSQLLKGGFLVQEGPHLVLTPQGEAVFGASRPMAPKSNTEMQNLWLNKLPRYESALLNTLLSNGNLDRPTLAELSGKSITSSAFSLGISRLKKNGLVVDGNGFLSVSDLLYPEGRR